MLGSIVRVDGEKGNPSSQQRLRGGLASRVLVHGARRVKVPFFCQILRQQLLKQGGDRAVVVSGGALGGFFDFGVYADPDGGCLWHGMLEMFADDC